MLDVLLQLDLLAAPGVMLLTTHIESVNILANVLYEQMGHKEKIAGRKKQMQILLNLMAMTYLPT